MKIQIQLLDLKEQKVKKELISFIDLQDSYIRQRVRCESDTLNTDTELWNEDNYDYDFYVSRSAITGIELKMIDFNDYYRVNVYAKGISDDIRVYFKTFNEANEFKKTLLQWWLNLSEVKTNSHETVNGC